MKFEKTHEESFFSDLNSLSKNESRSRALNKYGHELSELKQSLYDNYDIEELYLTGDFLNGSMFDPPISLYFEMTQSQFDDLVESGSMFLDENFKYVVKVGKSYYSPENRWKQVYPGDLQKVSYHDL